MIQKKRMMYYLKMFIQKMHQKVSCNNSINPRIYMFHKVCNALAIDDDKRFTITFDSYVSFITNIKSEIISLDNISSTLKSKQVMLTFDDGYEEIYTKVFPYMKLINKPFSIFLIIDKINTEGYLCEYMIEEMIDSGIVLFGSHTITHPFLSNVPFECAKEEIESSKEIMLNGKRHNLRYFAFPYGTLASFTRREYLVVKDNYDYAFSTVQGSLPIRKGEIKSNWKYRIPRINIGEDNYDKWM